METLFFTLPGFLVVATLLFSSVVIRSETYFCFLFISPPFLYALAGPFFGQSFLAESVSASMVDRIKFMACFAIPAFVSLFGMTHQSTKFQIQFTQEKHKVRDLMVYLVCTFCVLDLISIYLNRPVNGIGQSIYVPIGAVIVSLVLLLTALQVQVDGHSIQKAADFVILILFSFLLVNIFFPIMRWNQQLDDALIFSQDGYRFSPFSDLLNLPGRQSFFTTDPEAFAIFSFVCFSVLLSSKSQLRRILAISLVFVIGSTTQSRLFYLGIIMVTIIYIADKALRSSRYFRLAVLSSFFVMSFFLVFAWASFPRTGLASFSGRTYIWKLLRDNLNSEGTFLGMILGNFGNLSLTKFSEEQGSRLIFYHAHNVFLQYLWDWGILGLFLITALIATGIWLAAIGDRSSFLIMASLLFAGLIESTFALSLKSFEFFALILFLVSRSQTKSEKKSDSDMI
jgi:hypothetical protein